MAFTSVTFLIFLSVVFLVYFLVPKKMQWKVLLLASYIFYWTSSIKLSVFLILSTVTTYLGAIQIERTYEKLKIKKQEENSKEARNLAKKNAKRWVAITLIINFGILILLKYFNFFADNIQGVYDLLGMNRTIPRIGLILPLGISFYTFQSIGYIIDVYRKKIRSEKNIFKYALFVSFFPQIIQGPISRFDQLAHQLFEGHKFDYIQFKYGIQLMLWGYFKKMVIADRAGFLVDTIFNNYSEYSGLYYGIATVFYCIQIYGDFSGGIDIVRGISQSLGIDMVENFKRPYFAKSVSEFWKRWHITLGTWMQDYVFYPLALSRPFGKIGKKARKRFGGFIGKQLPASIASLIVFTIVGVWHGSSWKYVAFGLYHGFFILSSSLLAPIYSKLIDKLKIDTSTFSWGLFQILRTFFITAVGRFFSRGISFKVSMHMMISAFRDYNPWILWDGSLLELGIDLPNMMLLFMSLLLLFTVSVFQEKGYHLRETLAKQHIVFRWIVYYAAIFAILIFGIYGQGFDKTDFIYQGF